MSAAVVHDVYEVRLASSGKLKLRAKARLAEDTEESVFEACVLLHEAARLERRAIEALAPCPPATLLASLVEECWCLVEGLDPFGAAEAWGRILLAKKDVDPATAESMLERITPKFEAAQRAFSQAIASSPALLASRQSGAIVGGPRAQQQKARKEVSALLARFPGTSSFWWASYRLAEEAGDKAASWDALSRARQLAPDNRRFEAMSLLVATWALPRTAADQHLGTVRPSLERQGAEVCLMYALAELQLARKSPEAERRPRWKQASDAANSGLAQARTAELRTNLKAVQLLSAELLAGRKPTIDILYLAGLGGAAATAAPSANVIDLVMERGRAALDYDAVA